MCIIFFKKKQYFLKIVNAQYFLRINSLAAPSCDVIATMTLKIPCSPLYAINKSHHVNNPSDGCGTRDEPEDTLVQAKEQARELF